MNLKTIATVVGNKIDNVLYKIEEDVITNHTYSGFIIRTKWQQQTDPSCGIVAIDILADYVKSQKIGNKVDKSLLKNITCQEVVNEVIDASICDCVPIKSHDGTLTNGSSTLEIALKLGISNEGELFCAYNLSCLAWKAQQIPLVVKEINKTTSVNICLSICSGYPVLIPYDRSLSDHTPGLFDGRHAHWAIIVGFILPDDGVTNDVINSSLEVFPVSINQTINVKFYDIQSISEMKKNALLDEFSEQSFERMMVICMHGMSRQPFVCPFKEMIESNQQLNNSKSKFYLTSEDLNHLRNKIIFYKN